MSRYSRRKPAPGALAIAAAMAALAWLASPVQAQKTVARPRLTVSSDFPGGSGEVLALDQEGRSIRLAPSDHRDLGWRCWWYVKVGGMVPGETIALEVGNAPWATPRQAAWSPDGTNWHHTEPGKLTGKTIVYRHQAETSEAWFAWGPPFTHLDAERLVAAADQASPHASAYVLCRSREGRTVPALRVSEPSPGDTERYGIWIQARQHAWESGSSWVCRGFVEWLVSDDDRAAHLRRRALVTVVPVMDVDNVARGAGGKEQKPHDHNRDWTDQPHFPAVKSAMQEIARQNEAGEFDLFVDLHNPAAGDREPFFFLAPDQLLQPLGRRNVDRFLLAARLEMTGPLAFRGRTKESGPDYDPKWEAISKNWVTRHTRPNATAVTLETSWDTPHSTAENYRTVGRQLGLAIERHLRASPRSE